MPVHSASPFDSSPETQRRQLLSTLESYPLHDRVLWEPLQNAIDAFYDKDGNSHGINDPTVTVKFNTDNLSEEYNTISITDNGPGMEPTAFDCFIRLGHSNKYQTMEPLSQNYARIRRIIKGSQGVGVKGTVFSSDSFRVKSVYTDQQGELSEWDLELEDMCGWEEKSLEDITINYDDEKEQFLRQSDGAVLGTNRKSEAGTTGVSLLYKINPKISIPIVGSNSVHDDFSVSAYLDSIVDEYLQSIGNPVWDESSYPLGEIPEKPSVTLKDNQKIKFNKNLNSWTLVDDTNPIGLKIASPNSGSYVHRGGGGTLSLPRITLSEMIERWFKLSKYTGDLTRTIESARSSNPPLFEEHNAARASLGQALALFDYNEENNHPNPIKKEMLEEYNETFKEFQTTLEGLKNPIIDFTDSPLLVINLTDVDSRISKHFTSQEISEEEE